MNCHLEIRQWFHLRFEKKIIMVWVLCICFYILCRQNEDDYLSLCSVQMLTRINLHYVFEMML